MHIIHEYNDYIPWVYNPIYNAHKNVGVHYIHKIRCLCFDVRMSGILSYLTEEMQLFQGEAINKKAGFFGWLFVFETDVSEFLSRDVVPRVGGLHRVPSGLYVLWVRTDV